MHLQFIYIVYEFSWIICLKAYQFDLDWDISCALYLLLLLGKDMTSQLSSIFLYFLFSSLWLVTADRKWPRYTTQMVNVVESVHEAACRVSPAFLPSRVVVFKCDYLTTSYFYAESGTFGSYSRALKIQYVTYLKQRNVTKPTNPFHRSGLECF